MFFNLIKLGLKFSDFQGSLSFLSFFLLFFQSHFLLFLKNNCFSPINYKIFSISLALFSCSYHFVFFPFNVSLMFKSIHQGWSIFFSVKGQIVNILGFVLNTVWVTATQFCCRQAKFLNFNFKCNYFCLCVIAGSISPLTII